MSNPSTMSDDEWQTLTTFYADLKSHIAKLQRLEESVNKAILFEDGRVDPMRSHSIATQIRRIVDANPVTTSVADYFAPARRS